MYIDPDETALSKLVSGTTIFTKVSLKDILLLLLLKIMILLNRIIIIIKQLK